MKRSTWSPITRVEQPRSSAFLAKSRHLMLNEVPQRSQMAQRAVPQWRHSELTNIRLVRA